MAQKNKKPAYILISDGFDEYEVVLFLHKFRRAGLLIKSVSLSNRIVYSRQGVGLKADCEMFDSPIPTNNCLLILPAGGRNEAALRRDARLWGLLQTLDMDQTDIAITTSQSKLVGDFASQMRKHTYYPYDSQGLTDFAESLVDRLIV